jgi:flagella basal body P-ring formation protein FlgA
MRHFLMSAFLVTAATPAWSATLRETTTLQQQHVRISDLFDDAGPAAGRILGPGPTPGGRIVVEAAQAAAIARQFGIAWRPVSNAERVVIDRPGRLAGREEFIASLHAALAVAGAAADAEVELSGFVAPLVPAEGIVQPAIEQVDYEPVSGRFTATLAMSIAGEPILRTRLAGRAQEMVDVVVASRRLPMGVVLRAEDLQTVRMRVGVGRGDVAHIASELVGQATRKQEAAGQPMLLSDLGRPFIVQKGSRVMMLLQSPGLSMAATGQATEGGGMGDRISVLNSGSGALIDAEIVGPDQVRVQPTGAPRRPARFAGVQSSSRAGVGEQGAVR